MAGKPPRSAVQRRPARSPPAAPEPTTRPGPSRRIEPGDRPADPTADDSGALPHGGDTGGGQGADDELGRRSRPSWRAPGAERGRRGCAVTWRTGRSVIRRRRCGEAEAEPAGDAAGEGRDDHSSNSWERRASPTAARGRGRRRSPPPGSSPAIRIRRAPASARGAASGPPAFMSAAQARPRGTAGTRRVKRRGLRLAAAAPRSARTSPPCDWPRPGLSPLGSWLLLSGIDVAQVRPPLTVA